MNKRNIPISIQKFSLLQAYLLEIFNFKNQCTKSFNNTKWYLKENHTESEIKEIIEFLKSINVNCDCEILTKLDLREFAKDVINSHNG